MEQRSSTSRCPESGQLKQLALLVRQGRFFEVQDWLAAGKPFRPISYRSAFTHPETTARLHHHLQLKFPKQIPLCIYKYHNRGTTVQENWRKQIDKGRLSRYSSSGFGPARLRAFHSVQNLLNGLKLDL
jgi:hypothetical protein